MINSSNVQTLNRCVFESLVGVSSLKNSLLCILFELRLNIEVFLRFESIIYLSFRFALLALNVTFGLVLLFLLFLDLVLKVSQLFEVGSDEVLVAVRLCKLIEMYDLGKFGYGPNIF